MAKRTIVNPKGTFLKRCEVTSGKIDWVCGRKAVTRIRDIVCKHVSKTPFCVCAKHKREFLKCGKGEEPHYKEVRSRLKQKPSKG